MKARLNFGAAAPGAYHGGWRSSFTIQHRREAGAPTGDARLADQRLRVLRRNDPDHRRNVRADQGKILDLTTPAISHYLFRSAMPVSFNARVCCCCTEARGTPGVRVDDALL